MTKSKPLKKGAAKAAPSRSPSDVGAKYEALRARLDSAFEAAHVAFGEMCEIDSPMARRAASALDKLDPDSYEAISALMKHREEKAMQVLLRFNDALYYECERGELAPRVMQSVTATSNASGRWARLDEVKQWAFLQRRENPDGPRAALIRSIAPQIRIMTRQAGEPLSGADAAVIETITSWFRKAGIS